eukprot:CAMPEP_0175152086 /NCGR_PEP_ID=MMETSP0087-20121206/18900_1 /TAXON_ID=136419 /ORGANISM="Unknown Unknown, Strain D1" /LENGTH=235 /DNA_ID=CAMNT_0016438443 /DNA_START=75 /DNA_END=782 /DNA_ORIENTATION=+
MPDEIDEGDASVAKSEVLKNLVLEDTLRTYQQAAISTVENMASSFTAVAQALQKNQTHAKFVESSFQEKLNEAMGNINTNNHTIKELQSEVEQMENRLSQKMASLASNTMPQQQAMLAQQQLMAQQQQQQQQLPNTPGDKQPPLPEVQLPPMPIQLAAADPALLARLEHLEKLLGVGSGSAAAAAVPSFKDLDILQQRLDSAESCLYGPNFKKYSNVTDIDALSSAFAENHSFRY